MRIPFDQSSAVYRTLINLRPEIATAILRTMEAGWEIARQRPEVHAGTKEVEVTECLRDGMRTALRTKRLPWRRTMVVLPGTESRSQAHITTPDGRTDIPLFLIRIFVRSGEHDPHAIIECKRVAEGNPGLTREYVVEGIDRFRRGKYSRNHSTGFMAGYVIAGNPARIVAGINRYLRSRGRDQEDLDLSGFAGINWVWTSQHPRAAPSSPIDLHHAMLVIGA